MTIVTGGSLGIPGHISEEAHGLGGHTIMFSPDKNIEQHNQRHDNHEIKFYKEVVYGEGFTSRSLEMIRSVDCALVLNGRTGTLSEFTIAIEEGLPIAVITNTGGIADHLENIITIINKEFPQAVLFGNSYQNQIKFLLQSIV